MSRWMRHKKFDNTLWIEKPKRHYIITTDQKTFEVEADFLDYKKTIKKLSDSGYTNININYIGFTVKF